jgi:hypothetical protein
MDSLADVFRMREAELQQYQFRKWVVTELMESLKEVEFPKRVARELAALLGERDSVSATDGVSRRREEEVQWRDEGTNGNESWDRTPIEASGESCMSDEEANALLRSLRQKGKRGARSRR